MNEIIKVSLFFGLAVNLAAYKIGMKTREKTGWTLCNPLLIAVFLVVGLLKGLRIEYEAYEVSARYLTYLLTPATVCLAVPLYRQMQVLKENLAAVLISLSAGCLSCIGVVALLSAVFDLDQEVLASLLPKSITTAIAIDVAEEIGGIVSLTIMSVIITGLFGAVIATGVFKVFRIREPVAQGLACGASAHAIGTSKALELGEIQGAMSSLAIIITGIFTVMIAPVVMGFYP